jgi:hypothetical protein
MPALNFDASGVLAIGALAAAGCLAWWAYTKRAQIAAAVNPVSDKNLAYQAANSVVQNLPGANKEDTLGTWIAGILSPSVRAADAAIAAPVVISKPTVWDDSLATAPSAADPNLVLFP